jgi:hypothetical protein
VTILQNAIDSIGVGLEDFASPDNRRQISCARNLFAGILLLFKHKLSELSDPDSDEALIKQRVLPIFDSEGNVRWRGEGRKTVDVQNIRERFNSLGIEVDWERLDRMNRFRNDIEHYFSSLNQEAVRSLISDSFVIVNEFIRQHLNEDPKSLLGDSAWTTLVEVNEVYEREREECLAALRSLDYFHSQVAEAFSAYSCTECGSGLIIPASDALDAVENNFLCKSCNTTLTYDAIAKLAVGEFYEPAVYLSHKDGGDTPVAECPECLGIYLYEEGICSGCGYEAEQECQRCGSAIPPEELESSPFCGYCAHVMSKDD